MLLFALHPEMNRYNLVISPSLYRNCAQIDHRLIKIIIIEQEVKINAQNRNHTSVVFQAELEVVG